MKIAEGLWTLQVCGKGILESNFIYGQANYNWN